MDRAGAGKRIKFIALAASMLLPALFVFPDNTAGNGIVPGKNRTPGDINRLEPLIRQAMALRLSGLNRLLTTLFPDTRNPELIRLKSGFEHNFFLPPLIDTVILVNPEIGKPVSTGDPENCRFDRIDIFLNKRRLVKKLRFSKCLISLQQPELDMNALKSGKLSPQKPVQVQVYLKADFKALAAFIVNECLRNGATVPVLTLEGEEVFAKGRLRVLLFNLNLRARGGIYLNPEDRSVRFRARKVSIGRFSIPRFIHRSLTGEFNPVFRFEPLIFDLQPVNLQFANGAVELLLQGWLKPEQQE